MTLDHLPWQPPAEFLRLPATPWRNPPQEDRAIDAVPGVGERRTWAAEHYRRQHTLTTGKESVS